MFKTADQLGVILEMIYLNLLLIKPQYLVNKLKFVQKKRNTMVFTMHGQIFETI